MKPTFSNDQMLAWITENSSNGIVPSMTAIASHYGISVVSIRQRLQLCQRNGKIELIRNVGIATNDGKMPLTATQSHIKGLLEGGKSRKEICALLGVSAAAICQHVKGIIARGYEIGAPAVAA